MGSQSDSEVEGELSEADGDDDDDSDVFGRTPPGHVDCYPCTTAGSARKPLHPKFEGSDEGDWVGDATTEEGVDQSDGGLTFCETEAAAVEASANNPMILHLGWDVLVQLPPRFLFNGFAQPALNGYYRRLAEESDHMADATTYVSEPAGLVLSYRRQRGEWRITRRWDGAERGLARARTGPRLWDLIALKRDCNWEEFDGKELRFIESPGVEVREVQVYSDVSFYLTGVDTVALWRDEWFHTTALLAVRGCVAEEADSEVEPEHVQVSLDPETGLMQAVVGRGAVDARTSDQRPALVCDARSLASSLLCALEDALADAECVTSPLALERFSLGPLVGRLFTFCLSSAGMPGWAAHGYLLEEQAMDDHPRHCFEGWPSRREVERRGAALFKDWLRAKVPSLAVAWRLWMDPKAEGIMIRRLFHFMCVRVGYDGNATEAWRDMDPNRTGLARLQDFDWETAVTLGEFWETLVKRAGGQECAALEGLGFGGNRKYLIDEWCNMLCSCRLTTKWNARRLFYMLVEFPRWQLHGRLSPGAQLCGDGIRWLWKMSPQLPKVGGRVPPGATS